MKIVCVGDCGVDHYLPSGRLLGGGITANFARHAARAFPESDEIHVVSAIGSEPDAGSLVRRMLKHHRIRCHIAEMRGTTPVQFIQIDADGERSFVRYDEGVLAFYRIDESAAAIVRTADLLVTPVFHQIHDLFHSVMSVPVKGKIAVDFSDFAEYPDLDHLESYLDRIDIAFFGMAAGQQNLIESLATLAERWHKLFVVTLGANGSLAFAGHDHFAQATVPVDKVVDTTGAGDAFAAAFLASHMHGADVPTSLKRGAALSATVVAHLGAGPE